RPWAELIFFRALRYYIPGNGTAATFPDARCATLKAARDYSNAGYGTQLYYSTQQAWNAVGVPSKCGM
ncbi:MAG: M4 family metallopeptidase, partial [Pyrinomonadaceae bacterium]